MSISGTSSESSTITMGAPFLHEFKKQASFFLKEKIKTARLVLTDVTPAEILAEEITSGNSTAPDTKTMGIISRAAFEVDDYWRVVEILHKRLSKFDRKNWRVSYNSIILLEHLITHGPESASEEFQIDKDVIKEMESFQLIDEKGFNWGLAVRKKSERVSKLLEKGPLLKEERERSRKLSRGIQGFGSFTTRSTAAPEQGVLRETAIEAYGRRCNSTFNDHYENHKDQNFSNDESSKDNVFDEDQGVVPGSTVENSNFFEETNLKENMAPKKMETIWINKTKECKPLLGNESEKARILTSAEDEDHPFNGEDEANATLLATNY